MKIGELLDAARNKAQVGTDMALATRLGVGRAAVSAWRTGVRLPDEVAAAKLADLAGEPLVRVLGMIGENRAISREAKAVWRRLASAAAILLGIVAGGYTAPAAAAVGLLRIMSNWFGRSAEVQR